MKNILSKILTGSKNIVKYGVIVIALFKAIEVFNNEIQALQNDEKPKE